MPEKICHLALCIVAFCLLSKPAEAGPPFLSDDPEPVEYGHTELDFFTQDTHSKGEATGTLFGLDANYGVLPDVELTLITPLSFNAPSGNGMSYGYGDTQFAVKYRFIHESDDNWWPEVAIYPTVSLPTGDANRSLGTGHTDEFFPLWLQKDFDPWQTYGGGGYWHNPGIDNRNYWFFGWVLQRKIMDELSLGGELFYQTAYRIDAKDSAGFNLGGTYDIDQNYHILFTAGRGVQNVPDTNQFSYYLALQVTY